MQIGHLLQNLLAAESSGEQIEDIGHANTHASNAGTASALRGIHGDSIGALVHHKIIAVRLKPGKTERRHLAGWRGGILPPPVGGGGWKPPVQLPGRQRSGRHAYAAVFL